MIWLEYVVSNASWSLGGLLVGYLFGRTERTLEVLRKRAEEDDRG